MKKPDWNHWRECHNIELWKIVALSVDIEPPAAAKEVSLLFRNDTSDELVIEFNRRFYVLLSRLSDPRYSRNLRGSAKSVFGVLPSYAYVMVEQYKWPVPGEFAKLALAVGGSEKIPADATSSQIEPENEDAYSDVPPNSENPAWIGAAVKIADSIALDQWRRQGVRQITARKICDAVATELGKGVPDKPSIWWGTQGMRTGDNVRTVGLKKWKFKPPMDD